MADIFVDKKLEDKILRQMIVKDNVDDAINVKTAISKNIDHAVTVGLEKDAFSSPIRQKIYKLITDYHTTYSEAPSSSYLVSKFKKIYKNKDVFNKQKIILQKIYDENLDVNVFKPIVDELRQLYYYRKLFAINEDFTETLEQDLKDGKFTATQLAQKVQENVSDILLSTNKFKVEEGDVLGDLDFQIQELEDKKKNPEKYKGITSGYKKIDEATGGWRDGELILVLGRPGKGKSALLLNFAYNAWRDKFNVFYVTIEMPKQQQQMRFYSLATGTKYQKVKQTNLMCDEEFEGFKKRLNELKKKSKSYLWLLDAPEKCDVSSIETKIINFENVTGEKIDLLIIDPIYLMKPSSKVEDYVGQISWDLKLLARKLRLPVLAASQINREGGRRHQKGKSADTMDAAFSDKLSNNSDAMMVITGDKIRKKLSFSKARDSNVPDLFFKADLDCMKFAYDEDSDDFEDDE